MTNIKDILAKNMKAYRNALGLSQAKLAEKVDASTHAIGMIEAKNNFPLPEMLERIAAALGVNTLRLRRPGGRKERPAPFWPGPKENLCHDPKNRRHGPRKKSQGLKNGSRSLSIAWSKWKHH
jgi:transcriptional regulator with XRE-family HTH domain